MKTFINTRLGQTGMIKRRILKYINNNTEFVLDVGCCPGLFNDIFKDKFILGIDIDKSELLKAKNKNPHANYILANAEQLPIKNRKFDFVMTREILEHLNKPKIALSEINQVMKDDAIMYFSTPSMEFKNMLYMKVVGIENYNEKHGHKRDGFTYDEIKSMIEDSNLRIIELKEDLKFCNKILYEIVNFVNILRYPLCILWIVGEKIDEKINCRGLDYYGFCSKKCKP